MDRTLAKTLLLFLALAASGCGTRPSRLQPPSGKAAPYFPHTYPDPKTLDNGQLAPTPLPAPSGNSVTIAPDADMGIMPVAATTPGQPAPPASSGQSSAGPASTPASP